MTTKKSEVPNIEVPLDDEQDVSEAIVEDVEGLAEILEKEWNPPLPEAGGIAWCDVWGVKADADGVKHQVKINLTARGFTTTDALDSLLQALAHAREVYKLNPFPPDDRNAMMTAPVSAPQVAPVAVPPVAPPSLPVPGEPVYEDVAPISGGVINASNIIVAPRTDGKTAVEFYAPGRKFPEIKAVMMPEQLAALFGGGWTPAHFKVAGNYAVQVRVTWRPSEKLNSAGNPYKNIVKIEL